MKKQILIMLSLTLILLTSCSDDDPVQPDLPDNSTNGVYIINEGGYGQNNSSITYFDIENDSVYQNVFANSNNGLSLGDTGNDMDVYDNTAYVVVSTSNKIEIIDLETFESKGVIEIGQGTNPRELAVVDNSEAYLSAFSGHLFKLDLENQTVTDTVEVGANPEGVAVVGGNIYVSISGIWNDPGKEVVVIEREDFEVEQTLKVGANPRSILTDDEDIYVISGMYGQNGKVHKIDGESATVMDSVIVGNTTNDACLFEDDKMLVVTSGGAQVVDLESFTAGEVLIATEEVVSSSATGAWIYGIGYDSENKKIYCGNPKDFTQNGDVSVFSIDGTKIKTIDCGINPGTIYVKN